MMESPSVFKSFIDQYNMATDVQIRHPWFAKSTTTFMTTMRVTVLANCISVCLVVVEPQGFNNALAPRKQCVVTVNIADNPVRSNNFP